MIETLSWAAHSMNGTLHGSDATFSGVSTDTRSIGAGELFFALAGPNFDGHDYVARAGASGAAGAVVGRHVDDRIAQINVDDPKLALGRFGAAWRREKDVRVVGVTGSNGKTTLKEMIAACLGRVAPTIATAGNLNNDIGMPLMLTRIADEHEYAVLEMGANHAGEIAYLVGLANPDVVVITNAAEAHLEGFGSLDGVARAKGEILENRDRPDTAVLNADDVYFDYWRSLVADVDVITFGFSKSADVRASDIVAGADGTDFRLHAPNGDVLVSLPLPGLHNVRNACAAAAVALALDIRLDVVSAALSTMTAVKGRLRPVRGLNGCALYDDSYNANPLSVKAAADFLGSLPGESWLVLGDMYELGDGAVDLHREVGESARASGVSRLLALGDLTRASVEGFGDGGTWYPSLDELVRAAREAKAGTSVLVKGSRGMRMERVVAALRADGEV